MKTLEELKNHIGTKEYNSLINYFGEDAIQDHINYVNIYEDNENYIVDPDFKKNCDDYDPKNIAKSICFQKLLDEEKIYFGDIKIGEHTLFGLKWR